MHGADSIVGHLARDTWILKVSNKKTDIFSIKV